MAKHDVDRLIDAWVHRAVEVARTGRTLAEHPTEILDASVRAEDALALGKDAFMRLLPRLQGSGAAAYLVVSVGTIPVSVGSAATKAEEVETRGLDAFVRDEGDVVVGVSPVSAAYRGVEVVTAHLDPTVFKLPIGGALAYIRGMREQGDTEWSADAVLEHRAS